MATQNKVKTELDEYSEAALAALELDGITFSDQERQLIKEIDELNYSEEQIMLFLKAGR
ncbi:hypothetical protein [Agarilytica rhodophyticola]|uniref:hypothetical protein n=1 Tax=Agarilytica rhodophyticola TaxID=1737490 RepID=UPI00131A263C|nr:hypothetical protein [Agarilytica rhodophyticola]